MKLSSILGIRQVWMKVLIESQMDVPKPNTRLLWSNFPGEVLADGLIPCFPLPGPGAHALTSDEVGFLTRELSPVYANILEVLSRGVSTATEMDQSSCRTILRESVVFITYTLVDRILRLQKIISQLDMKEVVVPAPVEVASLRTNQEFGLMVEGSQLFNQHLVSKLASSIWGVPEVLVDRPLLSNVRNRKPIGNLNFDNPDLFIRLKRKISRFLSNYTGSIPALRLAHIESVLLDKGLYGKDKLIWLDAPILKKVTEQDAFLRKALLPKLLTGLSGMLLNDLFVKQLGMTKSNATRAVKVYCQLLLELIPAANLEGIGHHLECERHLKSLSAPALFICGPGGGDIYWIAAARKLKIPIVGVQHGAHYGFVNHDCFIERELYFCDSFISWGWTEFPNDERYAGKRVISLPSPWLTERVKLWKNLPSLKSGKRANRPHDVLLMTDRLQPFPPTITTIRMSRRDFLGVLNSSTRNIVSELCHAKIRVLHKPFNYTSRDIQGAVLDKLSRDFPSHYSEYKKLNKGLTESLILSGWMMVWDEPGTGFFECLVSEIPTMLYWERLTSHEELHTRKYFEQLERVGLLHTSHITLRRAVQEFLESPDEWLNNPERTRVIREVRSQFSDTENSWRHSWRAALKLMKH